ncbi:unnamed protein product, partial [Scytosiphon promiscuus]
QGGANPPAADAAAPKRSCSVSTLGQGQLACPPTGRGGGIPRAAGSEAPHFRPEPGRRQRDPLGDADGSDGKDVDSNSGSNSDMVAVEREGPASGGGSSASRPERARPEPREGTTTRVCSPHQHGEGTRNGSRRGNRQGKERR